ncbi:MAG: DNA polymerase I, partial [Rectinema sp.]|nr:DNA polymerase I [Rectinema sp.]
HVLITAGILPPNLRFSTRSARNQRAGLGTEAEIRCFDTMIAAWVLDADAPSFSLSSTASRWIGVSGIEYEDIVPKGGTFADVPLATATQYAAEDADFAFRLYEKLSPLIESSGCHRIFYDIEMPLLPILAEMERTGIRVDPVHLLEYGKELEQSLAGIESEVFRLVGHPFNLGSPKQLAEVLFSERKLPVQKHTKTGYSTDTSVLEELAPLDPVPQLILKHRLLSKLRNTYVEPLAELACAHGRVHTTYVQTGASTGRLSSRDPNLQNIPIRDEEGRKIREAFVSEPGWALISADYSQIELVVMAHLSQDPNLLKAFREGVDIHKRTAALIFGIPEADVDADRRRIAKTINFGVIYGMSAFRLARDLGIPNATAREFIDSYFSTYRGIADFIKRTIEEAQKTGMVSTLFGRKRKISGIESRNKTEQQAAQRVVVNTPIQGTAADIVKIAMIRVRNMLENKMPDVRMLLQVHDELIFEAPEALVSDAMQCIKDEMEHAVTLSVPLRVSVEAGHSWGEMHL